METRLVLATESDFDWMIAGTPASRNGLKLPEGGVDDPSILQIVKSITVALLAAHCDASWLMVSGDEIVGLCCARRPPANGVIEIAYGTAPVHQKHGHATRAVREMLMWAARQPNIDVVTAETATGNAASQRVLSNNGFVQVGRRIDVEDGEVMGWSNLMPAR